MSALPFPFHENISLERYRLLQKKKQMLLLKSSHVQERSMSFSSSMEKYMCNEEYIITKFSTSIAIVIIQGVNRGKRKRFKEDNDDEEERRRG